MILVMALAPRMDGPRVMCGMQFKAKTGAPGLTNLGLALLVFAPVVTYFVAGLIGGAWLRRRDARSEHRRLRATLRDADRRKK